MIFKFHYISLYIHEFPIESPLNHRWTTILPIEFPWFSQEVERSPQVEKRLATAAGRLSVTFGEVGEVVKSGVRSQTTSVNMA